VETLQQKVLETLQQKFVFPSQILPHFDVKMYSNDIMVFGFLQPSQVARCKFYSHVSVKRCTLTVVEFIIFGKDIKKDIMVANCQYC